MKRIYLQILLFLPIFINLGTRLQAQCSVPESPVLENVTVDPETGNVSIKWSPGPSTDIAGYVIYTFNNNVGIPVDTVWDPAATDYIHITNGTRYFSISYVVATHRKPNCTSPLSNNLSTIFAISEIDTCKNKIDLAWNSSTKLPGKTAGYVIEASKNGQPYEKIAELPDSQLKYEFTGFETDAFYTFVIKARLTNGDSSLSNKATVSTKMQRPPSWINADYATVINGKINLSFTADPYSGLSTYRLERKTANTGEYTELTRFTSFDGKMTYIDQNADPGSVFHYRLSAVNGCNNPVIFSNVAANLVLKMERKNNDILLVWNKYYNRNGDVKGYLILLSTGNEYREIRNVSSQDTAIMISYNDIMYEVATGQICFKTEAEEENNPYGINGKSASQEICTEPEEVITVPDVFTPNDDLINDLFRPVLSFTPAEYTFIISDRSGRVLFETNDHLLSWDGYSGRKKSTEGVYLWFLKLKTPSGRTISKTGTVTIYVNK